MNHLKEITTLIMMSALMFFSSLVNAELRYIDDTVQIPLRSGSSTEHRIISFLPAGTKVETKESDSENPDWTEVSLDSGKEGWVQTRYLKNTPAAKQLLAISQKELARLERQNREQKQTIKDLNKKIKELSKAKDSLSKHSSSTDQELAHIKEISKNAIRLDHSNTKLLEENEILKTNFEDSQQRVTKLENDSRNEGIIYGIIAIIFGVFLGIILPKLKPTRSNDTWA